MTINLTIPTQWNDLTTRQLKKIAVLFQQELKPLLLDYKLLYVLLNVRWWQIVKYRKFLIAVKNIHFKDLKEQYKWVYNQTELTTFIPVLKKQFHAPSDRLSNFTVDEFAHTEDLFLGWYKTKNIEYLHYLTAVLYRENDKKEKRLPFEKAELEKRAKYFSVLPKSTLLAIALSYQGCRTYITKQFPVIFPKSTATKTSKLPSNSGFGKIILHFAGGKFGTYNETRTTNLYTFLSEFEEQLKSKPYG